MSYATRRWTVEDDQSSFLIRITMLKIREHRRAMKYRHSRIVDFVQKITAFPISWTSTISSAVLFLKEPLDPGYNSGHGTEGHEAKPEQTYLTPIPPMTRILVPAAFSSIYRTQAEYALKWHDWPNDLNRRGTISRSWIRSHSSHWCLEINPRHSCSKSYYRVVLNYWCGKDIWR